MATFLDRYEITGELGRGGMGVVYRAQDLKLGREVAVKLVQALDHPQELERFRREAKAIASLRHPGIVQIFDSGSLPDGRPYLVMEFIVGESLKALADREPLELEEAVRLLRKVAEALAHCHSRSILHRDIKPHNIVVGAKTGAPVLLDFGLAREQDKASSLTEDGTVLGTLSYMAPEQADGQRVDERADVYGLGATLYYALTGQPPFAGDQFAVMKRIFMNPPRPPSELRDGIPPRLEEFCLRCLEKKPGGRPPSAEAFVQEITLAMSEPRRSVPKWAVFLPALLALLAGLGFLLVPRDARVTLRGGVRGMEARLAGKLVGRFDSKGRLSARLPIGKCELEIRLKGQPKFTLPVELGLGDDKSVELNWLGALRLMCLPLIEVSEGGRRRGLTNAQGRLELKLIPGSHRLRFRREGLSHELAVQIKRGVELERSVDLAGSLSLIARRGLKATLRSKSGAPSFDAAGAPLVGRSLPLNCKLLMGRYELLLEGLPTLGTKRQSWRQELAIEVGKRLDLRVPTGFDAELPHGAFWSDPVLFDADGDGLLDVFVLCAMGEDTKDGACGARVTAFSGFDGSVMWTRNEARASYYTRLALHESKLGAAIVVGERTADGYRTSWLVARSGELLRSLPGQAAPESYRRIAESPVAQIEGRNEKLMLLRGPHKLWLYDAEIKPAGSLDFGKKSIGGYDSIYRTPRVLALDGDGVKNDLFLELRDPDGGAEFQIHRDFKRGAKAPKPFSLPINFGGRVVPYSGGRRFLVYSAIMPTESSLVFWDARALRILNSTPLPGHLAYVYPFKQGRETWFLSSPRPTRGVKWTIYVFNEQGKIVASMPGGWPITLRRGKKTYVALTEGKPSRIVIRDPVEELRVVWRSPELSMSLIRAVDVDGDGRESLLCVVRKRLLLFDPPLAD